jgi:hypothetical protein
MRHLDPERLEDEKDIALEEAVVQGQASWFANSPWWLISAGIHAVLLLGASLWAIEKIIPYGEDEIPIAFSRTPPKVDLPDDRPHDLVDSKGIPSDEPVSQPMEEPKLFFPDAKPSNHNESADGEDYHQMKGDSKDFLSYIKGEAGGIRGRQAGKTPGVIDTMGVGPGGGGGGRYGGRFGGRENLVARGGGTKGTESAVMAALKWLARHQSPDGSWSADTFDRQCVGTRCTGPGDKDTDPGITGLSVLAFLGAGYSHLSKDEFPDPANPSRRLKFGDVVKKGLQWIMSRQDPEGCIGERSSKYMYNHTVAALALTEGYGMTAAQLLKEPAQRAVDFVISAQNPGKGWRYSAKSGDNDTSVTGWAIMVLKSAELSELTFPHTAYDGAANWLGEVTNSTGYYDVGYTARGYQRTFHPGKNEGFEGNPAMSAVAVMSRIFMFKKKADPALQAANLLTQDLPEWKPNKIDYYYWYYGSLALFQFDGPDGPLWRRWNEPMKNALVPNQKTAKDGCRNGSWDVEVDRWAFEGGRVYAVALNALTLEVYYRYANVIGVKK